jgi:phosphonate transport system substrate-binding protein
MFRKLLSTLTFGAVICGTAAAADMSEINFGIIATESSIHLRQDWQPVLDDMTKAVGVKINPFFATDYGGVIEAMRFNKVHVAWFGNKSGMEAVDRSNGEIFAQEVPSNGTPGYYSLLIVNKDSSLYTLEDVLNRGKDLSFGIGDPNSTSGTLVPNYYIFALRHIDPKSYFKVFRGSNHESNLIAVANKQVDVATNNTESWERFEQKMPDKVSQVRVVWKSPIIPSDPLVWRADLDPQLKAKIKAFFVGYGKNGGDAAREKANLAKLSLSEFRESSNDQLLPIRQLSLFESKLKIESDRTMAEPEKQAKLKEIDRKLQELNQKMATLK